MQDESGLSVPSLDILGIKLQAISVPELHQFIASALKASQKTVILHLNIHGANLAVQLPWFREFYNQAALVFCDGDGVRWGAKLLGCPVPPKITYAAWIWQLAEFCAQHEFRLYFLGSKPGVAESAAIRLTERFPNLKVAGTHHGYFNQEGLENEKVVTEINQIKPDILIVGLGMPLQENWIQKNGPRLEAKVVLTGGAVFDYASGNLQRAPQWVVGLHLEWLFRFFQEPKRLFKRYVIGNPLFLIRILKQRFKTK